MTLIYCQDNFVDCYKLLDPEKVGLAQVSRENGIFIGDYYVLTDCYKPVSAYKDTLPEPPEDWIFRLEITKYSENAEDVSELKSEVLTLPADENDLQKLAESLGEECIEYCDCLNFESAIPHINDSSWDSVEDVDLLNSIAKNYSELSREDAVKFKAVLASNPHCKLDEIADIIQDLDSYEFDITVKNYTDFGEKYLSKMLPPEFDKTILEGSCGASLGDKILRRNDCAMTDYGVVSKQGGHLYAMIESPECEEIQSPEMSF